MKGAGLAFCLQAIETPKFPSTHHQTEPSVCGDSENGKTIADVADTDTDTDTDADADEGVRSCLLPSGDQVA